MTPGEIVIIKLDQLLKKTKETLVADVEREFGCIRTAFLEGADATNNAKTREEQFNEIGKMVDAIFTQLGYDLSQYKNVGTLKNIVEGFLNCADKMDEVASAYNEARKEDFKGESVVKLLAEASGLGKKVLDYYKDFKNCEIERIEVQEVTDKVISDAKETFKLKTLRKLFDHIIIALLKNAREVFKDEIDYLENLVSDTVTTVQTLEKQLQSDIGLAKKEMDLFLGDALSDLRQIEDNIKVQTNNLLTPDNRKTLLKFYRITNCSYALLDFLGVIGEEEIEIKIPEKIKQEYKKIHDRFAQTVRNVKDATKYADDEINSGIKRVSDVAVKAKDSIEANRIYQELEKEFPINLEQLDLTPGNYVMLAQVNSVMDNAVNNSENALNYLNDYSYTYKYKTIRWSSIEDLFSKPIDYFKELYPIDDFDDAQDVITRILDIAHMINPRIPDFSTLRNMLEDLLKNLERRVVNFLKDKGKEVAKEIWEKVRPIIATVKQIIQMLKELALRLKEELETIIDGVYNDLSKTFGEVYNAIKAGLNEASNEIENEIKMLEDTAKSMADVVEHNAISIINDAKKGINDIGDSLSDAGNQLYSAIDKDLKNIEIQAAKAINQVFGILGKQDRFNELVLMPAYNATLLVDLQENTAEVDKVLNTLQVELGKWAYGVKTSVVGFVNPGSWEQRLAIALTDLQKEFKSDIMKVNAKVSKVGARQLLTNHGMVLKDLKNEVDINDYINILHSIVSDVVIPNPKAYYSSIHAIVVKTVNSLKENAKDVDVEKIVKRFVDSLWKNIKSKILEPIINNLKKILLEIVRKQIVNKLLRLINDATKKLSERFPSLNNISNALEQIERLGLSLDDLKSPDMLRANAEKQIKLRINQGIQQVGDAVGDLEIDVPLTYVLWIREVLEATIRFTSSNRSRQDIVNYVITLYRSIPQEVKNDIADLLPSLPDFHINEGLKNYVKSIDTQYDLDNRVACFTLLDVKTAADNNKSVEASCKLQLLMFVGSYSESDDKDPLPALYFCSALNASADFQVPIGKKHVLRLGASGKVGQETNLNDKEKNDDAEQDYTKGQALGFCLTKNGTFHGLLDVENMGGLFYVRFDRKEAAEVTTFLETKYVDFGIRNYPQLFYVGYNHKPSEPAKYGCGSNKIEDGDKGLTLGYYGGIEDLELKMKLSSNAFFQKFLKDDPAVMVSTSLLYDMQNGLKIDGGAKFHLDFDISKLDIGPVKFDKLSIDLGQLSGNFGNLGLTLGSSFALDFSKLTMSFENLGIGFDVNFLKPDGSIGDYDFSCLFQFPDGIGISIDTPVVKGAGIINYNKLEGTLFSALSLDVLKKFTVGSILDADLGIVDGHIFSLVALISTSFSPGIPIGMGFTLNGVGGCIGLNRMYDSEAISTGVRSGVFGSVFFVDNVMNHLTEMKTAVRSYFPVKEKQFFLGVLAKICFDPVITCEFGLLLQAPDPFSVGIVGALKVRVGDTNLVKINVYFFGDIDFDKGMRFDASIVDSEIVGMKLEGDLAFRLFWGGPCKGFGLSIGGFHPAYKPEEGLKFLPNMRRLSLKLKHEIVRIDLTTYLAITSNSFQIGASIDLEVGWKEFGLFGYASFDALFVFKPFRFVFDVKVGVAVKLGGLKLLSVDLALHVEGPAKWRVSGKASFTILFFTHDCDFSLAWGKEPKEQRESTIAIWSEVLLPELQKDNNWITSTMESNGQDGNKNAKSDVIILQPNDTLEFNQCAVPFEYEMEICNDSVPTDYTQFSLKKVSAVVDDKEFILDTVELKNDFAPSLYQDLSEEDRLSLPSYQSETSGFEAKNKDEIMVMSFGDADFSEAESRFFVWDDDKAHSGDRKSKSVLYLRHNKASFKRYVENLENKVVVDKY